MKPGNSTILIINGGSSSIKFAIYEKPETPKNLIAGQIGRIGLNKPSFTFTDHLNDEITQIEIDSKDFKEATEFLIHWLKKQKYFDSICCVGHRIVHGMEHKHPEIINPSLMKELHTISGYDLDHLPAEIEIIEFFTNTFPALLQVACFDTSFHMDMPRVAKLLPIPRRFDRVGIRRYGFHGLSYAYLITSLKTITGIQKPGERIILAHLGNGASLAAVKDGKSMDTSMGFTPAGGLVMGTRPGDIDPGVPWFMIQNENLTSKQFNHLINHESGLLGVSEVSSDMRDLLKTESSDIRAAEAVALFCYQVKKWIGAFTAVLNGLDTLVFCGGIGENAPVIRLRICENMDYLGIEINEEANNKNATIISTDMSKVKVYVIPTDEEIMIAKATGELYLNAQKP